MTPARRGMSRATNSDPGSSARSGNPAAAGSSADHRWTVTALVLGHKRVAAASIVVVLALIVVTIVTTVSSPKPPDAFRSWFLPSTRSYRIAGLMWQDTAFGETQDGTLFAECKSYNKFEKKDFDRMEEIAKQFPGAILAFCTLRKTLERTEIKQLKRLTKKGMKHWKTERPINPVLGSKLINPWPLTIRW